MPLENMDRTAGTISNTGRQSGIFALMLLCGTTVVMAISNYMSQKVTFTSLYIWESVLCTSAIVSMTILAALNKGTRHMAEDSIDNTSTELRVSGLTNRKHGEQASTERATHANDQFRRPLWTKVPLRDIFVFICGVGATILPVYEVVQDIYTLKCVTNMDTYIGAKRLYIARTVSNIFYVLSCVAQIYFVIGFKHRFCISDLSAILMSIVIGANFTPCVNSIISIITKFNTATIAKHNESVVFVNSTAVYSFCNNRVFQTDDLGQSINTYTYQFSLQFAFLSICYLGNMWITVLRRPQSTTDVSETTSGANVDSRDDSARSSSRILYRRLSNATDGSHESIASFDPSTSCQMRWSIRSGRAIARTFRLIAEHAFASSVPFAIAILALHILTGDGTIHWDNSYVLMVYTYTLSIMELIPFVLSVVLTTERKKFSTFDLILFVTAFAHLSLLLFETVDFVETFINGSLDSRSAENIMFCFETLFHMVGLYSQTLLVIKFSKLKFESQTAYSWRYMLIKGFIAFIGTCDLEWWVADNFLKADMLKHLEDIHHQESFGDTNWWFLTEIHFPYATTWRLHAALMCYEGLVRRDLVLRRLRATSMPN